MSSSSDPFAPNLSCASELLDRYQTSGIAGDIEEAIRIHREVLDKRKRSDPNRDESFHGLAECLRARFQSQHIPADLTEATSLYQAALNLRSVEHPKQSLTLGGLAVCLELKFGCGRKVSDLSQAISIHQKVLNRSHSEDKNRAWTLYNLASCLETRFCSQRKAGDLQNAVTRYREALKLRPVGHPCRASSLSALAGCLRLKSELLGLAPDLQESILLCQEALELQPQGHPGRSVILDNLALALELKFKSQNDEAELDRAISHHRDALKLRPIGDPKRPSSLHHLTTCLKSRFELRRAIVDLNEAIDFGRTLVGSHPWGDAQRSSYIDSLADCLEARYSYLDQFSDFEEAAKIRQELPVSHPAHRHRAVHNDSHIERVFAGIVDQVLETRPPRLLDTRKGVICERQAQIAEFKNNPQYEELLASARIRGTFQHSDIEHSRTKIAKYFEYAMLSHRWEEGEPLLEHVEGRNIYPERNEVSSQTENQGPKLKGLGKLEKFCRAADKHGFLWAWSDTCCINKKDANELQKAITSMFVWYRRSAMTLVYLADVPANNDRDELSRSNWFTRGWTLQELLAPEKVLFYSQDWTLYSVPELSDHMQDKGMVMELERITGIPSQHLTQFSPGMSNARLRLHWASSRRTTRQEDIAYCLFGIFDVHLPVLYGENKEKALGRLLQEVISQSGDTSVLDWAGRSSSFHSCFPASIETYRFASSAQPELDGFHFEQSLSRLRQLISPTDVQRFHGHLSNLPFPRFSHRRLLLPCVVHRIQKIVDQPMDGNNYVYEVQATNLRPLLISSSGQLRKNSHMGWLPFLIVRVLDQSLLAGLREGESDSAYKVIVELDRPFSALLLEAVSFKVYRRIASSYIIVARIDDSKRLADSEFRTLAII